MRTYLGGTVNNAFGYYEWSGVPSPLQNLTQGNVFFLQLSDAAAAPESAGVLTTSNYFNITNIPTPSSSSTAASAPTSTSSASNSASASASADQTYHPKNNDALPIGLGVGLALAILLATLTAGLFYRRHRKRCKTSLWRGWSQDLRAAKEPQWGAYSPYQHDEATRCSGSFGRQSSLQHKTELAQS